MPSPPALLVALAAGVVASLATGCTSREPEAVDAAETLPTAVPDTFAVDGVATATGQIAPVGPNGAEGTVRLTQTSAGVRVQLELAVLRPQGRHAVQILHGRDCGADPRLHLGAADGERHGAPPREPPDRHRGDLGNVRADDAGRARYDRIDRALTLDGTASAAGRAVVVRDAPDDGITQPDGAAGAVVGCGLLEADR